MAKHTTKNTKKAKKRVLMSANPLNYQAHPRMIRRVKRLIDVELPGFEEDAPLEEPITERLKQATKPMMVQVSPGHYAPAVRSGKSPDMCLCYWHDNGDGTLSPKPVNQRLIRLDSSLAKLLGFAGQYVTILRLGEAGFIEIIKATPGLTLINLDSWFNHLRRCAEDSEFWDKRGKNYQLYKTTII
jgi:hypothetical protein